jgi:hypothetical protein
MRAAAQYLAALLIGGAWLAGVCWHAWTSGRGGDFSWVYGAGETLRLRGPESLYDTEAMAESISRRFPREPGPLPYVRPPYYALLLAPFSLLAPGAALQVWLALNAGALVTALFLLARALGLDGSELAWHAAVYFPAFYGFFNRQDVPLVLLPAAAAYVLLARRRAFLAGLVLSLCAAKFHLLLLVPLALWARREYRVLAGLAVGAAVLVLLSLAMVGPAGLAGYARMLAFRRPPGTDFPDRLCTLWALAGTWWARAGLAVLLGAALWRAIPRLSPLAALAAAWMGSLLISPHVYLSDYLLALPGFLLLAPLSRLCRFASLAALFPFTPLLMPLTERFLLLTPAAALVCLTGAALARRSP